MYETDIAYQQMMRNMQQQEMDTVKLMGESNINPFSIGSQTGESSTGEVFMQPQFEGDVWTAGVEGEIAGSVGEAAAETVAIIGI